MTFSGPTKSEDLFPQGQRGGLRNIPYCGVINGLTLSLRATDATLTPSKDTLALNVAKGAVKFDGVTVSAPSDITAGTVEVRTMSAGESVVRDIYLNPPRKVPAVISMPEGSEGDMVLHVRDEGDYYLLLGIYRKGASNWSEYNPVNDASTQDHLSLPLNAIKSTLSINDFSSYPEKSIYRNPSKTKSGPRPGLVLVRLGLSFKVAQVTMTLGSPYTFGTNTPTNPAIVNYSNLIVG